MRATIDEIREFVGENLLALAKACVDGYLDETPETIKLVDMWEGDDHTARHMILRAVVKAFIEQEKTIADLEHEREGHLHTITDLNDYISEINERVWLED